MKGTYQLPRWLVIDTENLNFSNESDLISNETYRENAKLISKKMHAESDRNSLYKIITN